MNTLDNGEVGSSKGRKSKTKSREEKLADKIADEVNNHYFNLSLLANLLVNNNGHYTHDRLMELITHLIRHSNQAFYRDWEAGETSEGLLLSNALIDTLDALDK